MAFRQFVQVSNLSPEVNSRQASVLLPITANGVYPVVLKSGLRLRIVGVSYQTQSGTCVAEFRVGSTAIPNLTALNCSTTPQTQEAQATNDTNILDNNETLNVNISSASSLSWLYVTVYLRQIAATGGYDGGANDDPQSCEYSYANVAGTGNPPTPGGGGGGSPGTFTVTTVDTGMGSV